MPAIPEMPCPVESNSSDEDSDEDDVPYGKDFKEFLKI